VQAGYAAYQSSDLAAAQAAYRQALLDDAHNRDALLGLAATEVRAGNHDQAEAIYRRLLQADPRDAHADASLHFALGNHHAQRGRWAEARQAFARASAEDAEDPDFAFNLAVSLDQLRRPKEALERYRRALDLGDKRIAHFPAEAARQRIAQLSR